MSKYPKNIKFSNCTTKINIVLDDNFYLHGPYDLMFCFTAEDIKQAKQFSELVSQEFSQYISDIQIIEVIFQVKRSGMKNPHAEQLKEFF